MNYPKIVKSTPVAVSEFYVDWCPHCQRMMPVMDKVRDDLAAQDTNVFRIDCERHPDVADEVEVDAYPTIIFYLHGKEVSRITGENSAETIEAEVARIKTAAAA